MVNLENLAFQKHLGRVGVGLRGGGGGRLPKIFNIFIMAIACMLKCYLL